MLILVFGVFSVWIIVVGFCVVIKSIVLVLAIVGVSVNFVVSVWICVIAFVFFVWCVVILSVGCAFVISTVWTIGWIFKFGKVCGGAVGWVVCTLDIFSNESGPRMRVSNCTFISICSADGTWIIFGVEKVSVEVSSNFIEVGGTDFRFGSLGIFCVCVCSVFCFGVSNGWNGSTTGCRKTNTFGWGGIGWGTNTLFCSKTGCIVGLNGGLVLRTGSTGSIVGCVTNVSLIWGGWCGESVGWDTVGLIVWIVFSISVSDFTSWLPKKVQKCVVQCYFFYKFAIF